MTDKTLDDGASEDQSDAPWVRAAIQHEDRFLRMAAHAKNWRLFAFFCLALAAFAIAGNIYIGSKSKYIPMVMEVDRLGQVVAVKALTGDEAVTDPRRLVYREMFDLIEDLRTVTTDRQANNYRIDKAFIRLDGAAKTYVRTELRKAPPNEVGATKTVQVQMKSALRLTAKSWQLDWEEHSFNLAGEEVGVESWRAIVQYELSPSDKENIFKRNPIGFLVSDLSWQKVNK